MGKFWSNDRPEFAERVAKLAGGTTFREPWATGGRVSADKIPDAHAIAASLAMSRRGPDDIGPDVAYCWILQSNAYVEQVTRKLAIALRCHDTRDVAAYRLAAATAAWDSMIHDRGGHRRPAGCPERDWTAMLLASISVMHDSAWDSLAEAERRYRRVA